MRPKKRKSDDAVPLARVAFKASGILPPKGEKVISCYGRTDANDGWEFSFASKPEHFFLRTDLSIDGDEPYTALARVIVYDAHDNVEVIPCSSFER